jgi:protein phosphatase
MAIFEDNPVSDFDEEIGRYLAETPTPVRVHLGAVSHAGKRRHKNEDAYLVVRRSRSHEILLTNATFEGAPSQDDAYALLVADGMGGAAFGDVASNLALKTAWEWGSLTTSWIMRLNRHEDEVRRRAAACINLIHRTLNAQAKSDPRLKGMGSTLTVAYTMGLDSVIIHVGDSRAYLVREGEIRQLTRDQTLVQDLTDLGVPDVDTVGLKNVLSNSLGSGLKSVKTACYVLKLAHGDRLLLCTDGLTEHVSDAEILQSAVGHDDPQEACQALVEIALDRGGIDNITVVFAKYDVL